MFTNFNFSLFSNQLKNLFDIVTSSMTQTQRSDLTFWNFYPNFETHNFLEAIPNYINHLLVKKLSDQNFNFKIK